MDLGNTAINAAHAGKADELDAYVVAWMNAEGTAGAFAIRFFSIVAIAAPCA